MEKALDEEMRKEEADLRKNGTIYDLLKLEHNDVKKLFKQILGSKMYQENTYAVASKALTTHLAAEEKVFYAQLVNNPESRIETLEGFEEHDLARKVMGDIESSTGNDVKFAKVKVLAELVEKHVDDEEKDIYGKAKKVLSKDQERLVARQFVNEKKNLLPTISHIPDKI